MYKFIPIFFIACISLYSCQNKTDKQGNQKTNIIMDTDFGPDYDDVGAITVLHAYADSGYVNILATIASTKHANVAAALSVFNTYFNRPYIPVGVPKGEARTDYDVQHWTDTIVARYPHAVKTNENAMDAVQLYRKILSSQSDSSVTIVTTGFLTNVANLLLSPPDQYSTLSGKELIKKKVRQMVTMGGSFPKGKEYNICTDSTASKTAFDNWPTKIIFSGAEIGAKIKTGIPLICNNNIKNSPVKDVFRICIPMCPADSLGRMSWDETAILVACKGVSPFYELVKGEIIINKGGSNSWDSEGQRDFYLKEKCPVKKVQDLLNQLMMHQPVLNK